MHPRAAACNRQFHVPSGTRSGHRCKGGDVADPVVEIREPGKSAVRVTVSGSVEIGRECDGVNVADPKVSRRHVLLTVRDGTVTATDLGSANGSFLGGARLAHEQAIEAGTVLRIGDTEIEVLAPVAAAQPEIMADDGPLPGLPDVVTEPRAELRTRQAITGDAFFVRVAPEPRARRQP